MATEVGSGFVSIVPSARGFRSKLERQVGPDTDRVGASTGRRYGESFSRSAGSSLKSGLGRVTKAAGIGLLAAAGGAVAGILSVGTAYQDSLLTFQAATKASVTQMDEVKRAAQDLGANLTLPATSAADAAAAMTELAKGGLSVKQSMSAALGTLQLSAAAQVDGAQAAEIQAAALNQFGLKAKRAGRVADVLANTANAASGEITDMSLALSYVGPVAKAFNIGIQDTAATIGLLAKGGILGEKAGTALRATLAGLASPSDKAAKALKTLKIEAFDASGEFKGMRVLIEGLSEAQSNLTKEQFNSAAATAFGREPLAAIATLAAQGAGAFDDMAKAVGRQGGAADLAAAKTKGLRGAWEGFKSQLETVAIQIFDETEPAISGMLRNLAKGVPDAVAGFRSQVLPQLKEFGRFLKTEVGPELVKFGGYLKTDVIPQLRVLASVVHSTVLPAVGPLLRAVTEIVQAFTGLPGPVQFAVLAFAGAGRAASLAAPGIGRFTTSLRTARAEGGLLRGGLRGAMGLVGGPWGLAFAGAVGVLGSFAARNATAKARVNELAGALDQETGAVNRNTRAVVVNQLERDGTLKKARQFGLSLRDVTDASLGNEAAQRRVNDSLAAYVRSVDGANAGTRQAGLAGSDAREKVDLFKRSIGSANKALQDARTQQKRLRDAMRDTGSEAVSLGKNFTTSLAAGIRRGGDVAVAEAAGVANKINAQFARINEIHSPSKVWTRFGLALPAGLALGIRQGTGDAVDALTRMAQSLLDKAVARFDRVKARLGELRSELQALKSSVRDAVTGTLDVGSLRGGLGAMFDIKALASKAGAFVKALGNLARKGVAPGLIELIAQAGPDQGLAAAQSIAAMNKKQIKSVNADFNALGRYANQAANIAGNVSGLPEQIAQLKEIKEGVRALVRKRERNLNVFIELEDGSTPRRVRRKKLATAGAF